MMTLGGVMQTKLLDPNNQDNSGNGKSISFSNKSSSKIHTVPLVAPYMPQHQFQARSQDKVPPFNNIGLKIAFSQSFKEVMGTVYLECSRWINTDNFALAIYDDQTDSLTFPLVIDQGQRRKPFLVQQSHLRGLISDTLTQRIPICMPDLFHLDQPASYAPLRPKNPIRSWLSIPIYNPLRPQEDAQGVIIAWSDKTNAFSREQLDQLAYLGPPTAIAIRNIQMNQINQRRALELAVINDIVQTLASTLKLDEVLARIMELVEGMFKVEGGALLLTDPATDELVFQVALGTQNRAQSVKPFRLSKGQNIASYVALIGKKSVLLTKVTPEKRPFINLASHLQIEPRNCLYVPLILKEHVIGVIGVMNKTEGTFTKNDLGLLESIATYAAIAINNARLHEDVLIERDRVMGVEEQVRKKVAGDLHDGPTQLISSIQMRLDFCQKAIDENPKMLPTEFTKMKELAERAIHQMRTMLVELLPLDLEHHGQGLAEALRVLLSRRQEEIKTPQLRLNIKSNQPGNRLSRQDLGVEKAIFIIIQETVNNAIKHARANQITVDIKETGAALQIQIIDDGQGFDASDMQRNYAQRASLGMISIQERAQAIGGELTINTAPNRGTRISLNIPKLKAERLRKRSKTGHLTLPSHLLPTDKNR